MPYVIVTFEVECNNEDDDQEDMKAYALSLIRDHHIEPSEMVIETDE